MFDKILFLKTWGIFQVFALASSAGSATVLRSPGELLHVWAEVSQRNRSTDLNFDGRWSLSCFGIKRVEPLPCQSPCWLPRQWYQSFGTSWEDPRQKWPSCSFRQKWGPLCKKSLSLRSSMCCKREQVFQCRQDPLSTQDPWALYNSWWRNHSPCFCPS